MTTAISRRTIAPGSSSSLGACVAGEATNFALFSAHADAVELCLFNEFDDET